MPEVGERFRLSAPLGAGTGALIRGQVVTVREFIEASTKGAHDDSEDALVVEWDEPAQILGDDGEPTAGFVRRAVSVGVSQFDSLFEKVA